MTGNAMPTEELRRLQCAACGDKDPDCKDIVLSPRCHPGRGVEVLVEGQHVGMKCHVCGRLVAVLHAPEVFKAEGIQTSSSCHDKGVFVVYRKPTHALDFQCAGCKKVLGTLPIPAVN